MQRLSFTMLGIIATGLLAQALAVDGLRVNGRAVTVKYRHGNLNWSKACCEGAERTPKGSIELATILNGHVSNVDTIYDRALGFAQYPSFNYNATKVAFYRHEYGARDAGTVSNGSDCIGPANDGKQHVSIVNIDGTNVRDLCVVDADFGEEQSLDWPAGDWIYYIRSGTDIWRVNSITSVNERVCDLGDNAGGPYTCSWIRRFSLDAEAQHSGVQTFGNCMYGMNGVMNFPPANCNMQAATVHSHCCCNLGISPSGNYFGWYMGGTHSSLYVTQLNLSNGATTDRTTIDMSSIATWVDSTSVGSGAEVIRFAVNSDKWVMQQFGWYGHAASLSQGGNSVACNWIDNTAIMISNNPYQPNTKWYCCGGDGMIFWNNSCGDMWIDGGAANINKYENTDGTWTPVNAVTDRTYVPAAGATTIRVGRTPILSRGTNDRVFVMDLSGRTLFSETRATAMRARSQLPKGAYLMRSSEAAITERFVVR